MRKKFVVFVLSCSILFSGLGINFAQEKKEEVPVAEEKKVTPVVEEKRQPAGEEKKPTPTVEEQKITPAIEEKKPTLPVEEKKPTIEEKKIIVTVESIEGTARLQLAGTKQWDILKIGTTLFPGDTVTTFTRSKVVLKFEDESTVEINENSIFTINELKKTIVLETKEEKKEANFILSLGKVNAKTKKLGPKDKFEIYTPAAVCSVRGTYFSVEVEEKKITKVKVFEGNVGVREISGIGEEVLVKENQQTVVQPGTAPTIPEEIPPGKTELPEEEKPTKPVEKEKPTPKEEKPVPEKAKAFGMGGNFGAVTLTGPDGKQKVYSQISLQPEFSIGKFGIGLDLYFYFDENNNLREEDWDSWSDLLTKIMFLRYGLKREPVYVYLGVFPGVTLGHGLIMNRYSNMLKYPDIRIIGFELDLDFGLLGFESLVTDVQYPEIFGGRVYTRPFYRSGVPLLRKLALGGSGVFDINPDSDKSTKDDLVNIVGFDLDLPVLEKPVFSLLAYADVARIELGKSYDVGVATQPKSGGIGYAFGFMGNIVKFINYRLEYRSLENNFIPRYFDTYYENERRNKPLTISSSKEPRKQGPYLEMGFNLLGKINFITTYEDNNIDNPYLYSEFNVEPALLMNKCSFSFSYSRKNMTAFLKGGDTVMTTKVGYQVASSVFLILTRQKTFDLKGNMVERTFIETKMKL